MQLACVSLWMFGRSLIKAHVNFYHQGVAAKIMDF